MVDAEGLARRGVRRGGVVHGVWELLLQLQIVQNEAVAVVGYAEAVRGLAIGSSSEVGADPGCQPGEAASSQRYRPRSVERKLSYRQPAWRRSAGAEGLPQSRCLRKPPVRRTGAEMLKLALRNPITGVPRAREAAAQTHICGGGPPHARRLQHKPIAVAESQHNSKRGNAKTGTSAIRSRRGRLQHKPTAAPELSAGAEMALRNPIAGVPRRRC